MQFWRLACGTSTIVDVRRLKVNVVTDHVDARYKHEDNKLYIVASCWTIIHTFICDLNT